MPVFATLFGLTAMRTEGEATMLRLDSGTEIDNEMRRRAADRLESLHKGLGLRHRDLRNRLGPDLRRIWQITEHDNLEQLRAKVVLRLEAVLEKFTEPTFPLVVAACYNVGLEPPMSEQKLGERLQELHRHEGEGFSKRQAERLRQRFRDELVVSLGHPQPVLPPEVVRARVLREQRTDQLCRAIRELSGPANLEELVLRYFVPAEVHVPRSVTSGPAIAHTATQGDWLCVFTSAPRLARYRHATGVPWSGKHWTRPGAQVLREAVRRGPQVGVLINPNPRRENPSPPPLPLVPALVHKVAARL